MMASEVEEERWTSSVDKCAWGDNDRCIKLCHKIVAQWESSLQRYLIQSKAADAEPKIQRGALKCVTHEIHLTPSVPDSACFGKQLSPQRNGISSYVPQEEGIVDDPT